MIAQKKDFSLEPINSELLIILIIIKIFIVNID